MTGEGVEKNAGAVRCIFGSQAHGAVDGQRVFRGLGEIGEEGVVSSSGRDERSTSMLPESGILRALPSWIVMRRVLPSKVADVDFSVNVSERRTWPVVESWMCQIW